MLAYRDHEVLQLARWLPKQQGVRFQVLHFTVNCADTWRVRRALARCGGAGVLRCEPLLHEHGACAEGMAPRARLVIRLAASSYPQVLRALLHAVPAGELGSLVSWREHLRRLGACAS